MNLSFSKKFFYVFLLGSGVPLAGVFFLHAVFHEQTWINVPVHSVVETLGSFIAFVMAAFILLSAQEGYHRSCYLWITCAFVGMGVLDVFHAAVAPGSLFVWLHSLAVFIGGVFFVLAWLPGRIVTMGVLQWMPWIVFAAAFFIAFGSLAAPSVVPVMVREGQFTPWAYGLNVAGGVLFWAAAVRFLLLYRYAGYQEGVVFASLCCFFGAAGIVFRFSHLWCYVWWWWHFLRLAAYLITLRYIFFIYRGTEQRLQETLTDLQRSRGELEQFAFIASHDLQEPLRMVSSYTQLLEKRYKGRLDRDADDFIRYAVDGAKRIQTLIFDFLEYISLALHTKEFSWVDCSGVLKEAAAHLKAEMEKTRAALTQDPLPRLMADRGQMVKLFDNLIENAVKFRGEDPPRIHVSAVKNDGEWLFSVRDNGIGIEPRYKEKIFDICQRLHTRGEYAGSGIGLALCRRIVEHHGGRIWVESAPGKGSTFYFTVRST